MKLRRDLATRVFHMDPLRLFFPVAAGRRREQPAATGTELPEVAHLHHTLIHIAKDRPVTLAYGGVLCLDMAWGAMWVVVRVLAFMKMTPGWASVLRR